MKICSWEGCWPMLGKKHWEWESLCVYLTVMDIGMIFKNLTRHFPNVRLCKQREARRLFEYVTTGLTGDMARQQAVHGPMFPAPTSLLPPSTSDLSCLGYSLTGKPVFHVESSLTTLFLWCMGKIRKDSHDYGPTLIFHSWLWRSSNCGIVPKT